MTTAPTGGASTLSTNSRIWTRYGNVARVDVNFNPSSNVESVNADLAPFGLKFMTSVLLDNADTPYATTFYFPQTTQNVIVPANSQLVVPLAIAGNQLSCTVSTTIGVTAQVTLFVSDGQIMPASWSSTPAQSGGSETWSYLLLTVSGNWTVPSNWNSASNLIEAYGAGSSAPTYGSGSNYGGAGGSYASISNYIATPGASIPFQIGAVGGGTGAGTVPTANTWLNNGTTLVAAGSNGQTAAGITNCVGTVKNSGGNGGNGVTGANGAGGGGGGAGGPNGAGLAGGNGVGTASPGAGGAGDISLGGAGGAPGPSSSNPYYGGAGGNGLETNASWGSGGGGGAGGGVTGPGYNGGYGGLYGGGGGGASRANNGSSVYGGGGAAGAIIISWLHP